MARILSCAVAAGAVAAIVAASAAAGGPWDSLAPVGTHQHVTIHILPAVHGREVVADPNVAIVPDVPVRLVVVNTSREMHTFAIPQLHVNVLIRAGTPEHPSRTTVAFTAPSVGTFTWHCALCPAVHHEGGMHGRVYALVGA